MIKDHLKGLELTKPSQLEALISLVGEMGGSLDTSGLKHSLYKQYKIAVVANMSAGKSTFINALFADDILPSYSEATTDCPVYIYSDDNPDNDKAIIEFLDGRKNLVLEKDEVKKELKSFARKDYDGLDDRCKSVKAIHLHWDFRSLQNSNDSHLKFIIIDTPGPNNTDKYGEKHHHTTKEVVLNEADMVLCLFDYGQIDSNLEATKENLWGLIRERKEADSDFEAFFIINKIDMAFEDNKKLARVKESKTKEEFYQKIKEYWFYHENKAIEKIVKTAQKCGFLEPKVYTASSYYHKLLSIKDVSFDEEDKLDVLKRLFQGIFKESWQEELLEYLRINYIEDRARIHLSTIEQKLIGNLYGSIADILEKSKNPYQNSSLKKIKMQITYFDKFIEIVPKHTKVKPLMTFTFSNDIRDMTIKDDKNRIFAKNVNKGFMILEDTHVMDGLYIEVNKPRPDFLYLFVLDIDNIINKDNVSLDSKTDKNIAISSFHDRLFTLLSGRLA